MFYSIDDIDAKDIPGNDSMINDEAEEKKSSHEIDFEEQKSNYRGSISFYKHEE